MTIKTTREFDQNYSKLPQQIKKRAEKQFIRLVENPHHPSLHIKKMAGYSDIWEGRITYHYRFTFNIVGKTYILRRIGTHDILRTP